MIEDNSHKPNSCEYDGPRHVRTRGWCHECGGTGHPEIYHEDRPRTYLMVKDFLKALHEAGVLPQYPQCSRVVIDANINDGLVIMYVDQIPSEALLTIAPLMKDVNNESANTEAH